MKLIEIMENQRENFGQKEIKSKKKKIEYVKINIMGHHKSQIGYHFWCMIIFCSLWTFRINLFQTKQRAKKKQKEK